VRVGLPGGVRAGSAEAAAFGATVLCLVMAADDRAESREEVRQVATGAPRGGLDQWFAPGSRAGLWAGLSLIALSLLGAAWIFQGRADALALERDPVRVEGQVVRLWVTRENNGPHYRVEYEYAAGAGDGARVFRDETQLVRGHYDLLREGGPIVVAVCRTDPANHQVVGGRPRDFSTAETMRVPTGLAGLLAVAGAITLWSWWTSGRRPGSAGVRVLKTATVTRGGATE
jgi:hypothetical protein